MLGVCNEARNLGALPVLMWSWCSHWGPPNYMWSEALHLYTRVINESMNAVQLSLFYVLDLISYWDLLYILYAISVMIAGELKYTDCTFCTVMMIQDSTFFQSFFKY